MIDDEQHPDAAHGMGWRQIILTGLALIYVLFAEYTAHSLAGVTCLFFAVYMSVRLLTWFNTDRFSPRRLRVGATWVFVGIDEDTEEFDSGPARTYFSLLLILFAGLILRPVLGWLV